MTLCVMAGSVPVFADAPSGCEQVKATSRGTIVIDGREYGPKDGLEIVTFQCEHEPGLGPVGGEFGDAKAAWGASYAISTEDWQWWYHGRAKAAANIYQGQRIIQVCIWYTRGGVRISPKVCSNAASTGGSWLSGPEVTTECTDTIDPNAPDTIFKFSLGQINP